MNTRLYYYTGTGNSLWIARQLAGRLQGETALISLGTGIPMPDESCERIGIVFPVHIWGVPRHVLEFVEKMTAQPGCYFFAIAVNAGQVAATLVQLKKSLAARGILLGSGFDLKMPSNLYSMGWCTAGEKTGRAVFAGRKEIGQNCRNCSASGK